MLCNSDQISPLAEERWITDLVIGDLLAPQTSLGASQTPSRENVVQPRRQPLHEGVYYSNELDVVWRLRRVGESYEAITPTGVAFSIDAVGPDRLAMRDGWFEIFPRGRSRFELHYDNMRPIVFQQARP